MLNLFMLRLNGVEKCSVPVKIDFVIKDHQHLFAKLPEIIKSISLRYSEGDLFNLHCTTAHHAPLGRKKDTWQSQDIIAIDLDPISESEIPTYINLISERIGVSKEDFVTVWSGHGLHIYIQVESMNLAMFEALRPAYRNFTTLLMKELHEAGLAGKCDDIWDTARTLRLPGTRNIRPICSLVDENCEETKCYVAYGQLKLSSFDLRTYLSVPTAKEFPKIQDEFIVEECAFIRAELANGGEGSDEPRWVKALGVVSFFEDAAKYVHEVSNKHLDYTWEDTEIKVSQRLNHGPRSCSAILEPECDSCQYRESGGSPVHLKRPQILPATSILTKIPDTKKDRSHEVSDGSVRFSLVTTDEKGKGKKITRLPNQLREHFSQLHPYISLGDVNRVMIYKDNHYQKTNEKWIKEFANTHYLPEVEKSADRKEFFDNIVTHNVKDMDFFMEAKEGLINLQNGVLKVKTGELLPHSPKYAFQYILPYGHDPLAKCPVFDQLLENIFEGRPDAIQTVKEYLGYCVLGGRYKYQNSLVLYGPGGNGKSTIAKIFLSVLGEKNCSNIRLRNVGKPFVMSGFEGKLANIAEDEGEDSFKYTDDYKTLTGDSTTTACKKFENEYSFRNRAKLLMTMNNLPEMNDLSEGMNRRPIILQCNLDLKINTHKIIPDIDEKIALELPGILNVALAALKVLEERRGFIQLAESQEVMLEMRSASSEIVSWCEENIDVTFNMGDRELNRDIYDAYCKETGGMILNLHAFMKKFNQWAKSKRLEPSKVMRVIGDSEGPAVRGVSGIKIR